MNLPLLANRDAMYAPMDHQIDAEKFIHNLNSFALFMEQGTGKSKVVMMKLAQLCSELKVDRLLIVCPGSVKYQWAGEVLEEHSTLEYKALAYDGFSTNKKKDAFRDLLKFRGLKVMSIHYEAFQHQGIRTWVKLFLSEGYPMVVADESTKIKNPDAKQTQTIVDGFRGRLYKAILSGTPTPNNVLDLYSQFEFLKKGFWGMSYRTFKKMYCILIPKINHNTGRPMNLPLDEDTWWLIRAQIGARVREKGSDKPDLQDFCDVAGLHFMDSRDIMIIYNQDKYSPFKNMEQIWSKIGPYTFTVRKEDCLDLPDKIYERLEVDLVPEQKRVFKELKRHLVTEYAGQTLTASNAISCLCRLQAITGGLFPYQDQETDEEGLFDLSTHYKRMSSNPKMKALLDDLETVQEDTSVIIWAIFTEELKWIHEEVKNAGYSCELYIGATKEKDRKRIEEDFKAGKFKVLVITPFLGEMGLNFQISTLQYFYSNNYKADMRLQAEDRSHRMGQTNKVTYKDIICIGSVDGKILEALKSKKDLIEYFRKKPMDQILTEVS